jgi:hypothetical protein
LTMNTIDQTYRTTFRTHAFIHVETDLTCERIATTARGDSGIKGTDIRKYHRRM